MNYKKKLIEVALPLEAINKEAAREKSIRHGHPSTLHLWWARRPLAACRAVLFASLVDDPSECVAELMKDSAKRKAAERELKARKKLWDEQAAFLAKAQAAGIAAPPLGPEPKLDDIVAEIERERLFGIIRELVIWKNSNDERILNKARYEIARSVAPEGMTPPTDTQELLEFLAKHAPPVYDPFCGGGSIPLEAQRLGLEAHASDLNPVPVLINKALIEIPPKFAGKPPVNPESRKNLGASGSWKGAAGLAEDIRYYGQWMRDEAEKRIGHLYPKVKLPKEQGGGEAKVIAWLWARTVASPNPAAKGVHVPLVRSFKLCAKPKRKVWLEPIIDLERGSYTFKIRTGDGEPRAGTIGRGKDVCLLTNTPLTRDYIRSEGMAGRMGMRLMAIVVEGPGGRFYFPPSPADEKLALGVEMPEDTPDTDIIGNLRYLTPVTYGMTKHRHLFTNRQLVALSTLQNTLPKTREKILTDCRGQFTSESEAANYADAVITYLGLTVSKQVNRLCALCFWDPMGEKIQQVFARQALPINWDFIEGNPFSNSSGNFLGQLDYTLEVLRHQLAPNGGHVSQHDATQSFNLEERPVFSTDPPYYDNVPYSDLSDFFYVWQRPMLRAIYPSLFGSVLTPKASELVADKFRQGSQEKAQVFFEKGFRQAFTNMRHSMNEGYPMTVFYAFKQSEDTDEEMVQSVNRASTGWETMLEGMLHAGFAVDGTWPMRTELIGNLKRTKNALASSIVIVARPRPKDAAVASRRDFLAALKRELPDALRHLQKGNIAPVDLAQAAIGPGMAVFSRYAKVLETDGSTMPVRSALTEINKGLDEVLAEQEGEFDADTRWALAWFDQNGFNEGAYGVAETLCTAKNTSVQGMKDAGILEAKGGKVRLLKKEEIGNRVQKSGADSNSYPLFPTSSRPTIWRMTHELIAALEQGESGAAELIHQLGAKAEVARDLSYRLYTICERRKWAQEAIAYNALVLSWSDVQHLAQEKKAAGPTQGEMQL